MISTYRIYSDTPRGIVVGSWPIEIFCYYVHVPLYVLNTWIQCSNSEARGYPSLFQDQSRFYDSGNSGSCFTMANIGFHGAQK